MTSPKHPPPPHVRAKVGLKDKSRDAKLKQAQDYISGQAVADPQNKLTQQMQKVSTTRSSLVALLGVRSGLLASLDTCQGQIVVGDFELNEAMVGYATGAAQISGGDAALLANLGVDAAKKPTKKQAATVGMPVLTLFAGQLPGDLGLKCGRVPGAGAYIYEYKFEPSLPTDPYLSVTTKLASTSVSGLPPAQLVRARVRAVGVTMGPWSVEVVGRAK